MSDTAALRFLCDACGKSFKWKTALAGKKAKCPCGVELVVPKDPPGGVAPEPEEEQEVYDFRDPPPEAKNVAPPKPETAEAPTTIAKAKTLSYAQKKPQAKAKQEAERAGLAGGMITDVVKDLVVPLVCLVVGIVLLVTELMVSGGGKGIGILLAATMVVLVVRSLVTLGVAFLTAGWLDVSFGHPLTAMLQLVCMITLAVGADSLVAYYSGWYMGFAIGYVTTLALLCYFFSMELGDALNFAAMVWVANWLVGFAVVMILIKVVGGL